MLSRLVVTLLIHEPFSFDSPHPYRVVFDGVATTVEGAHRVAACGALARALLEAGMKVLEISQTAEEGSFAMVLLVDACRATTPIQALRARLEVLGRQLGARICVQREDIFQYMHRV
ncbi:MAG: ACT domain-containing protein [Armatimonadetes bacterium]|nr:ACT domain-containing protein [Armatimonadota bacterium]